MVHFFALWFTGIETGYLVLTSLLGLVFGILVTLGLWLIKTKFVKRKLRYVLYTCNWYLTGTEVTNIIVRFSIYTYWIVISLSRWIYNTLLVLAHLSKRLKRTFLIKFSLLYVVIRAGVETVHILIFSIGPISIESFLREQCLSLFKWGVSSST